MYDKQAIRTDKTKWNKSRKCACGDCRFYSEEERPKCPAMIADSKLEGEWLWYMDPDLIGCKDYVDPVDFSQPKAYTEKEKNGRADEATTKNSES